MSNTNEKLPEYRLVPAEQVQQYRRIPALAVHWCNENDIVLIGGGGGTKGTGIQSGIVVNTVSSKGVLTPVGFLDTQDKLVAAIAAHPNAPILACAVAEFVYIVRLENTALKVLQSFKVDYSHDGPFVACLIFDPSGDILASGGQDSVIRTFSYPSYTSQNQFKHHQNCIETVSFNRNSKLLAVTSKENFFSIWQIDRSKMSTLSFRNMEFRGCVFCLHHDQILYTWMNDRQFGSYLAKWDVISGKILKLERLDEKPVTFGRLSDDGSAIAVTTLKRDCTVYTFDVRKFSIVGRKVVPHDFPQTSMDFSPVGDRLISVSADTSAIVFRARSSSGFTRSIFFLFFIAGLIMSVMWPEAISSSNMLDRHAWDKSIDSVVSVSKDYIETARNWYSSMSDSSASKTNFDHGFRQVDIPEFRSDSEGKSTRLPHPEHYDEISIADEKQATSHIDVVHGHVPTEQVHEAIATEPARLSQPEHYDEISIADEKQANSHIDVVHGHVPTEQVHEAIATEPARLSQPELHDLASIDDEKQVNSHIDAVHESSRLPVEQQIRKTSDPVSAPAVPAGNTSSDWTGEVTSRPASSDAEGELSAATITSEVAAAAPAPATKTDDAVAEGAAPASSDAEGD